MFRNPLILIILTIFFHIISDIQGQNSFAYNPPIWIIEKFEQDIYIDGKLEEEIWSLAKSVELIYEISPGDNTEALVKTIVLSVYSNESIYFSFRCFDPEPKHIRANITSRDNIELDDYVSILLDTYGDHQKAIKFAINPHGIQSDFLVTRNGEDPNFDLVWDGAAKIDEKGWSAEIRIPFSSLQFPDYDIQEWGLNIIRSRPRESATLLSWTRWQKNVINPITQGGSLRGISSISSSYSFEILPYIMGESSRYRDDYQDNFSNYQTMGRIGGSVKYSITSDVTVEAVVNPDFSQIETDAERITTNTSFALSYPEKRPFFLDGQDLLQTPMYYSRSINNPLAAGRVLGKSGSLSYLFLSAFDRNTIFVIPGEDESSTIETNKNSLVNIARLRYDYGNENFLGLLAQTRNLSGGHNYLLGMDWNYKFLQDWNFAGETYITITNELDSLENFYTDRKFGATRYNANMDNENYTGFGIHAALSRFTKHTENEIVLNNFSPTYQAYNGSFYHTNFRSLFLRSSYIIYPQNSFMDKLEIGLIGLRELDYSFNKKKQYLRPYLFLTTKGQTNVILSTYIFRYEKFLKKEFYNLSFVELNIFSSPTKLLAFKINGTAGNFIYRSDSPVIGEGHNFQSYILFNLTDYLKIKFSYDRASLSTKEKNMLLYDGNIYRAVINYNYSSKLFFRLIGQYNSFEKQFYVFPLVSYEFNAFTTFYLGSTSEYNNYGQTVRWGNTSQQYFLKFQYLLGL